MNGTAAATPRDPTEVAQKAFFLPPRGGVPNHPLLPALVFKSAIAKGDADAIKALFEANGWRRVWDYTVFDYHHFHPDAHETLCVARGRAVLTLGGPGGRRVEVERGDALVLPAGTGHRRAEASQDFLVCGGYPPGQTGRSIVRAGEIALDEAAATIAAVALPDTDPLWGAEGPLIGAWAPA